MNICWTFTQPKAIQDVNEFVSSSELIWRNVASHHLLTDGSSAVNGCRQNVQTADKNITIIHKQSAKNVFFFLKTNV